LNDHLAVSVAALELVDHLVKITKSTDREDFFLALGQIQHVEAQRIQVARMAFEPDDVRTAAHTR